MKQSIAVALAIVSVVVFAPSAEASTVDLFTLRSEVKVIKKEKPKKHIPDVGKMVAPVINEYVVVEGDTLDLIAKTHATTWERLWQKNLQLTSPDVINVGDKLIIPAVSEVLADRPLPAPTPAAPATGGVVAQPARAVIPGNGYDWGWCTHWVKNMRPDLPNDLGNADVWYDNAASRGYSVGYAPQVGAVAAAVGYMHVAYVLAVDGNRVLVSEMNYNGFGVVSERWSDTSEWRYIY